MESQCLAAASSAAAELDELDGPDVPQWSALAAGLRSPQEPEHHEPGAPKHGWQGSVKQQPVWSRDPARVIVPRTTALETVIVRSQAGANAGNVCVPVLTIEPH